MDKFNLENIKRVGTKIYYCNITGNVLKIIYEREGFVEGTSFEDDCKIYEVLSERNISTIDFIYVDFGMYFEISKGSTGVRVNLETKELEFSYGALPEVPQEPNEIDVIKDKIDILEAENKELKDSVVKTQTAIDFILMNNGGI